MSPSQALEAAVEEVLDSRVRPMLKAHGGGIELAGIDATGTVHLRWLAACTGCPLRPMTTAGLLRPELEALDGVTGVDAGFNLSPQAAMRLERITSLAASTRRARGQ